MIVSISPAAVSGWSWNAKVENNTIHSDDRNDVNSDYNDHIAPLVIVVVGILIIFIFTIFHECLKYDGPISVAGLVAAVIERITKKNYSNLPPPYEDPPSYAVALQVENEFKNEMKYQS
eukprot:GFUD01091322.1.p1 GENE.GFUD01091322.1~~GFUD01091322.1.p1  ORF type:complete len:119 (-),score=12.89 GFUD01091322.1:38-394(-)